MAKAQVEITAVDRTKTAIDSASRGLQKLESGAAKLQSRFNLAFSLVTGGFIINGFTRLADAAAKTEQGSLGFAQALDSVKRSANQLFAPSQGIDGATKAMYELRDALNDPSIKTALNGIIDTMIIGFAKATTAIVKTAGAIRTELVALGAVSAQTTEDQIAVLERQLAALSPAAPMVGVPEVGAGSALMELLGVGNTEEIRKDLESQLRTLRESLLQEVEVTGRRRAAPEVLLNFYDTPEGRQLVLLEETLQKMQSETTKAVEEITKDLGKVTADIPEIAIENFQVLEKLATAAAQNIQTSFANFLFDPFQSGLMGMLKGFIDTIRRMIAEIAASMILTKFFSWMGGLGGFWGQVGTAATKALTGKAMGGSVMGGQPYMVGERGPELFVPGSNGSIVPNDKMGGTTIAPVYNIDARGATADLQKSLPGILAENNRRIFDELDRRYGIGR